MSSKSKRPMMYLEVGDYVVTSDRIDATIWEVTYINGWDAKIVDVLLASKINNVAPQGIDISMLETPNREQLAKFNREIN